MPEIQKNPEQELMFMRQALDAKLIQDGKIIDYDAGHLFLPWITDDIDPQLQRYAAKLIAHRLRQLDADKPDRVTPVPWKGVGLAFALGEELGVNLRFSRKNTSGARTWEHPLVLPNKELTNGKRAYHAFNFSPGERVILVDEMLGDGTTIIPDIEGLRDHGVIVDYVAVYAKKNYRPGYQKLLDMGVQTVAAYNIDQIHPDGRIVLTQPVLLQFNH